VNERGLGVAVELPGGRIEDAADGAKDLGERLFVFREQLGARLLQYLRERLRIGFSVVAWGQLGYGDERGTRRGHRRWRRDQRGWEERGFNGGGRYLWRRR
jgi:hypothetical protein